MYRLVATLLLSTLALCGQTNRGSISGTVSDSSKAVIAGAKVTITNVGTNAVRRLTTSDTGAYTAVDLEPVVYILEVEAQGFKKALIEHVKVDTATAAAVNVVLEPGSVDTKITVSAEAAMVNTESAPLARRLRNAKFRTSRCSTAACSIWRSRSPMSAATPVVKIRSW